MASKSKRNLKIKAQANKKIDFYLYAIPLAALFIKVIVMANTPGHGWLGADGESYLSGVDGLIAQGYFSDKEILSYWPAGYPILIWLLTKVSLVNLGWLISLTQSFFYAYSSYYFTKQLSQTKLRNFVIPVAIVIAINPTLSLSSLSVGYESPIASCMLMSIGLIIRSKLAENGSQILRLIFGVGFFAALASFMQPRWVLTSLIIAVAWALTTAKRKQQALILTVVVGVMAIAPLTLIQRNSVAFQKNIISTNLSSALLIGTGPETNGSYTHTGPNITCGSSNSNIKNSEGAMLVCATKWYLTNPIKTLQLSWNKSLFFWSPWAGPVANGTMARNPWLKVDPTSYLAKNSKEANEIVNGIPGKVVSWLWVAAGIYFLFCGFRSIRKIGGLESQISYLLLLPIVISWISAIATIGDHRFRVPTMPLSLTLQIIGMYLLVKKVVKK